MIVLLHKNWFRMITVLLILSVVLGVSYWLWWGSTRLPVIDRAPDFTLQNLEGKNIKFSDLNGKIRVVEFFYANCPDVCPTTTANMVKIQNELKKKNLFDNSVDFVSISFDPERDTSSVLQKYAERLGIDQSGWTILRGTEESTQKVAKDFGVFVEKEPDGSFVHSTGSLYLVDRSNNLRKVYAMGDKMPTDKILDDILNLANE